MYTEEWGDGADRGGGGVEWIIGGDVLNDSTRLFDICTCTPFL